MSTVPPKVHQDVQSVQQDKPVSLFHKNLTIVLTWKHVKLSFKGKLQPFSSRLVQGLCRSKHALCRISDDIWDKNYFSLGWTPSFNIKTAYLLRILSAAAWKGFRNLTFWEKWNMYISWKRPLFLKKRIDLFSSVVFHASISNEKHPVFYYVLYD